MHLWRIYIILWKNTAYWSLTEVKTVFSLFPHFLYTPAIKLILTTKQALFTFGCFYTCHANLNSMLTILIFNIQNTLYLYQHEGHTNTRNHISEDSFKCQNDLVKVALEPLSCSDSCKNIFKEPMASFANMVPLYFSQTSLWYFYRWPYLVTI